MSVRLRTMTLDDLDAVVDWSRDRVFCRASGWPVDRSPEQVREHWKGILLRPAADFLRRGVEADGRLVGYVDLARIAGGRASLGIAIGERRLWGRGAGTAAARLMLAHAFDGLGLSTVHAEVHETNARSLALVRGLGFRPAGVETESEMYEGARVRVLRFALDASGFAARAT